MTGVIKALSAGTIIGCLLLVLGVPGAPAATREYPSLYKSPRALGMGGAGVAIGGTFDSVFSNPAGLGKMPAGDWEVNILGLRGEYGQDALDFVKDLGDAFDAGDLDGDGQTDDDKLAAINDVLRRFRGKNMHVAASELTSVARNSEKIGFGVGALGTFTLDMVPHQGFGSDGLLEVHANYRVGGIGSMSYRANEGVTVGASLKFVHAEGIDNFFTVRELSENEGNLKDYFTDELREESSTLGADAGVIYDFARESVLRPSVGFSLLNIGDLDLSGAGSIPMTANVGVAVRPEIPYFGSLTLGLDYVDLFNNFDEDEDVGKRLRLGVELVLLDNWLGSVALRTGLYQGYPTFGADVRLTVVTLSYVTYGEELGGSAGQDEDRRHLVMLGVGW